MYGSGFTAKYQRFLKDFQDIWQAYQSENPDFLTVGCMELAYIALKSLKGYMEKGDGPSTDWDLPYTMIHIPVVLNDALRPILFTVTEADLRDPARAIDVLVDHMIRARLYAVTSTLTKDVAIIRQPDGDKLHLPDNLIEDMQGLKNEERTLRERDLFQGSSIGYPFDFPLGAKSKKQACGVVGYRFVPLCVSKSERAGKYPILVKLQFTNCKASEWKHNEKKRFWAGLLRLLEKDTPTETTAFLADVTGAEERWEGYIRDGIEEPLFIKGKVRQIVQHLEGLGEAAALSISVASGTVAEIRPQGESTSILEMGHNAWHTKGHFWRLKFRDTELDIKDSHGMKYITHLVRNKKRPVGCLQLWLLIEKHRPKRTWRHQDGMSSKKDTQFSEAEIAEAGLTKRERGGTDLTDPQAKRTVIERRSQLMAELKEATQLGHQEVVEEIQKEIKELNAYLNRVLTPTGRIRQSGDPLVKIADNVWRSITRARDNVKDLDSGNELWRHLYDCVKRDGIDFKYDPWPDVDWQVD